MGKISHAILSFSIITNLFTFKLAALVILPHYVTHKTKVLTGFFM